MTLFPHYLNHIQTMTMQCLPCLSSFKWKNTAKIQLCPVKSKRKLISSCELRLYLGHLSYQVTCVCVCVCKHVQNSILFAHLDWFWLHRYAIFFPVHRTCLNSRHNPSCNKATGLQSDVWLTAVPVSLLSPATSSFHLLVWTLASATRRRVCVRLSAVICEV